MKILVIGSGGREHALCWKIKQSPLVKTVYCAPGNAGINNDVECVNINAHELDRLMQFAIEESIDLTVVGPELPLTLGIVDLFKSNGLTIFGPSRAAAEIEGSKIFSKELMRKHNIPTANYSAFRDLSKALDFIDKFPPPFVVKADGLAAGKGVFICDTIKSGAEALEYIMTEKAFGAAGKEVVIEEFIIGQEASYFIFTDGSNFIPLQSSQDHKAAFDGDKGPNTGGMGAYSPAPVVTKSLENKIINKIAIPTLKAMESEGRKYQGILYLGLMIDGDDIKVLEYNCRFGDPEAQPLLFRIKSDLVPVMQSIAMGKLKTTEFEWDAASSVCVVLASKGYPGNYDTGYEINNLDVSNTSGSYIFHAGTRKMDGKIVTSGGRVLGVTSKGKSLADAVDLAYSIVNKIGCANLYFRSDIGKKALIHQNNS